MSLNFFLLCHYNGTIVPYMNNSIIYIDERNVFLNATRGMSFKYTKNVRGMSFKYTKNVICERLGMNYNEVEINITWRCLVGEYQKTC
jgi:uncharacterized protein YlbG (UPF0298 family)